ncbi:MAG: hypothetical protein ACTHMS_15900 [Jatrophihabitans sp.]|uniref:hypothetical protein n=1 Tax=Jatrophihabitans sp. TaxID=1932789 RepID=UPI003F7F8B58
MSEPGGAEHRLVIDFDPTRWVLVPPPEAGGATRAWAERAARAWAKDTNRGRAWATRFAADLEGLGGIP